MSPTPIRSDNQVAAPAEGRTVVAMRANNGRLVDRARAGFVSLRDPSVLLLVTCFLVASVCVLWYQARTYNEAVRASALQEAATEIGTLRELRTLYTSEVVERVRGRGIEVAHDYAEKEGAIPLPATLSMLLGNRLADNGEELSRLYSPYPFPWREETGGLRDDFSRTAWDRLTEDPEQPFFRFETSANGTVLRYAEADVMRSSCVPCHNTHPETPRSGWEEGDVRGVLEVRVPVATAKHGFAAMDRSLGLIAVLSALGACCVWIITTRLRRDASLLEERVESRTKELESAQVHLHMQKDALDESAIVSVTDVHGAITYANDFFSKISGYSSEELIGQDHRIIKSDEHSPEFFERMWKTIARGNIWRGEIKNRAKDGSYYWVYTTIVPFLNRSGKPYQYYAIRVDITERKLFEQKLRANEARVRAIVRGAPDAIIGIDAQGRIIEFNPAAEAMFGIPCERAVDLVAADILVPVSRERGPGSLAHVLSGGELPEIGKLIELQARRHDGSEFPVEMSVSAVEHDNRQTLIATIRDVTERQALEKQLISAQKLESIGQLAAGIAHEINTPTQYIGDNTHFLEESFGELAPLLEKAEDLADAVRKGTASPELADELKSAFEEADVEYLAKQVPRAIERSLHGIERVRRIVQSMKEFSHPGIEGMTHVNINHAIESTITVATNEWKYVAELETDLDPELPAVPGLPGELNQVILNLIVNAAHAIGDVGGEGEEGRGTITISTRSDGEFAEIRITDTGTGIPEAIRGKIFDPFFTTKKVGKGTGQGLSIAYGVVVKKHGGKLDFETEIGKGTTFIIRLPLQSQDVEGPV